MKKAIVLGGGIAGTTISYLLSENSWDVALIEKKAYLGGGFKTFYYGGHPYTLGPRPLASRNEEKTGIFAFVDKLAPLRKLDHGLLTYVERDGNFYSYPIHEDDIPRMPDQEQVRNELEDLRQHPPSPPANFEEYWAGRVGQTMYDKFINTYSKKMWQLESNTELKEFKWSPKGFTLKSGSRLCSSDYCLVGYPLAYDGYDAYFRNTTRKVKVLLNSVAGHIDLEKSRLKVNNEWLQADIIVSTISLDTLMDNCFGVLPYLGRDFLKLVLPVKEIFPDNVQFIYYANEEPFTRVVEYKKLTFYDAPTSLLGIEIPSRRGRLYPLPFPEPKKLAQRYKDALPDRAFILGRLGTYTYDIDMEGIILQAFDLINHLKG